MVFPAFPGSWNPWHGTSMHPHHFYPYPLFVFFSSPYLRPYFRVSNQPFLITNWTLSQHQRLVILLMEEHQLIGSLSHYLQGFIHARWCRISSINSNWGPSPVQIAPKFVSGEHEGYGIVETQFAFDLDNALDLFSQLRGNDHTSVSAVSWWAVPPKLREYTVLKHGKTMQNLLKLTMSGKSWGVPQVWDIPMSANTWGWSSPWRLRSMHKEQASWSGSQCCHFKLRYGTSNAPGRIIYCMYTVYIPAPSKGCQLNRHPETQPFGTPLKVLVYYI